MICALLTQYNLVDISKWVVYHCTNIDCCHVGGYHEVKFRNHFGQYNAEILC